MNMTGCVEEFAFNVCEDVNMDVRAMALASFRTGFCAAVRCQSDIFVQCTTEGEFDADKFSRLMKPFLDDMANHAIPPSR